LFLFF